MNKQMKHMWKRIVSVLLLAVLVVTMIPAASLSAAVTTDPGGSLMGTGLYTNEDGDTIYVVDGQPSNVTNVMKIDGEWYYIENGYLTVNTVGKNTDNNTWWAIDENGKVDFNLTGIAVNSYGGWYCKGGKVDFATTGVVKDMAANKWVNVSNGKWVTGSETVAKNDLGWWYIDEEGYVDFDFTGFSSNSYGTWYCQNGKVNFDSNGVVKGIYQYQSKWGFVSGGKLQTGSETVAKNSLGWWYIGKDGFVDFTANTIAQNSYGWWYVKDGKVDFSANTVAKNANGWWYVKNGKVDFSYIGVAQNDQGWWRIENGKVNFSFTGIASNSYGSWYCKNGKVDFTYSGTVTYNGRKYDIINGKVQNTSRVICIDAGHQGKANTGKEPIGPGASTTKQKVTSGTQGVATGLAEYKLNLSVALKLQKELEDRGYTVVMVRTTHDVNISNAERAQIANNSNADAFIRIHANSSTNTSVNGVEAYCQKADNPWNGSLYNQAYKLSKAVVDGVCASTGQKNRGVFPTNDMSGINWASVPTTIIEMGYMSNASEDKLMATDAYQTKCAKGIADGIDAYFGN